MVEPLAVLAGLALVDSANPSALAVAMYFDLFGFVDVDVGDGFRSPSEPRAAIGTTKTKPGAGVGWRPPAENDRGSLRFPCARCPAPYACLCLRTLCRGVSPGHPSVDEAARK